MMAARFYLVLTLLEVNLVWISRGQKNNIGDTYDMTWPVDDITFKDVDKNQGLMTTISDYEKYLSVLNRTETHKNIYDYDFTIETPSLLTISTTTTRVTKKTNTARLTARRSTSWMLKKYRVSESRAKKAASELRQPLPYSGLIQQPFRYGCCQNSTNVGCAGVCPETCEFRSKYCVPMCGPPCRCRPGFVYHINHKGCRLRSECNNKIPQSHYGIYRVFI